MGFLSRCGRILLDFVIITAAVLLFPGIPPDAEFDNTRFPASPELSGALAPNERLSAMERLLDGGIYGPESTAEWEGAIYTGGTGGGIVRLTKTGAEVVARLAPHCHDPLDVPSCGRPLGMRFDQHGHLFVADAYLGLHRVNVTTGAVERLVPAGLSPSDSDKPLRFFNDVAPARDGMLYFTTSSSVADLHHGFVELGVKGTGRVLKYDPKLNTTVELLSGVNFANGLALDAEQKSLLVSETGMFRLRRYWLAGSRQGQSEVVVDNLPGFPDNIRERRQGGFYVGLCGLRYQNQLQEMLRPWPLASKLLMRVVSLALMPVKLLESVYPNPLTQTILYKSISLEALHNLSPRQQEHGMVLELDARGAVVGSLHSQDLSCISQLSEHAGALYAGSPFYPFLGKVGLPKQATGKTARIRKVGGEGLDVTVG